MRRTIVLLICGLVALWPQPTYAGGYGGTLYSVVSDRGTFPAKWDWGQSRWVDVYPSVKRAFWEEAGTPSNPLVPVGNGEFLTQMDRRLTHLSEAATCTRISDDYVDDFCYNSAHQLVYVITVEGLLECITWPGAQVRPITDHPPLQRRPWPLTVSSYGDILILGGSDGNVYQATVGEYQFSSIATGVCPKLSPDGRLLAFSELGPNNAVTACVVDLGTGDKKRFQVDRGFPEPMWLRSDRIVYPYRWKPPFPPRSLEVERYCVIDISTGSRADLHIKPDFIGCFSWSEK